MANSAEDVALLLKVISGYDADDPYSALNSEFRSQKAEGLRVGVPDEYFFTDLHPDTEKAVQGAIKTLGEIGFQLIDVSLPGFEVSEKASAKILLAEAATYHQEHIEQNADQIGEDVLTRFKWGLEVTGVEYAQARRTQTQWRRKMERLFETVDALVLPATPFPATPLDGSDPLALSKGNLTRFTRMFNLTGNPSIVLPCGRTQNGLPIGVQIVGPHWREDRIVQVARAYEEARGKFGISDL